MSDIETSSEPKFAALVGIDWGDKKHAWALQVEGSSQIEHLGGGPLDSGGGASFLDDNCRTATVAAKVHSPVS